MLGRICKSCLWSVYAGPFGRQLKVIRCRRWMVRYFLKSICFGFSHCDDVYLTSNNFKNLNVTRFTAELTRDSINWTCLYQWFSRCSELFSFNVLIAFDRPNDIWVRSWTIHFGRGFALFKRRVDKFSSDIVNMLKYELGCFHNNFKELYVFPSLRYGWIDCYS
jgi:hypothetical protein